VKTFLSKMENPGTDSGPREESRLEDGSPAAVNTSRFCRSARLVTRIEDRGSMKSYSPARVLSGVAMSPGIRPAYLAKKKMASMKATNGIPQASRDRVRA
jgi:hypothetical protein